MAANIKVGLFNQIYTKKICFKALPKRRKFLPFPQRKAAINATLTAYAKQIISLFTRMLKVGL
jgi:hypothetical protein